MKTIHKAVLLLLTGTMLSAPALALAQDDDTGTNPINFTKDFRIYMEAQNLPGDAGNSLFKQTFEYRWPVLGGKLQVRTRIPVVGFSPEGDSSTFGLGDLDLRLLTVPYVSRRFAIATGLETFFDSATNDVLGSGKTALAPVVFFVAFNPGGLKGTLLAPGYQYVFDVAGESDRSDIRRSQIDLFFVWISGDQKHWIVADPQIVLDHENDTETGLIEVEVGQMMFGATSSYIRPGFHIAGDELYDWNIELGFKVIWR